MKILLGVTGSPSAELTLDIINSLQSYNHEVNVILTDSAKLFISKEDIHCHYWEDYNEYILQYNFDNSIKSPLHIVLKNWANALVIAPLTAHTMGKIANGLADNLLSRVVRSWQANKPIIAAPSMEIDTWNNPATQRNIDCIKSMYSVYRSDRLDSYSKSEDINLINIFRLFYIIAPIKINEIMKMAPIEIIVETLNRTFKKQSSII